MPTASKYTSYTDSELLHLYQQQQDSGCLGALLQRYTILLLAVCMKYLKQEEAAKDAVQQVFSKVITEVDKYPINHFKSWLYMIAKNHCLMQLRQKKQFLSPETIEYNPNYQQQNHSELWEEEINKESLLNLLEKGLQLLQPAQQQCVGLFYLHKKSYQQISEATGISLLQVKSNIQNGKRNIRIWMEKQLQQHG